MNRRHLLAASLSALLASAASRLLAQNTPAPKPAPRRVRITVSLLEPSEQIDHINANWIEITTNEDAATYAAFVQMYTFQIQDGKSTSQAFGPSLLVTPHIEADGKITVTAAITFEQATSEAAPHQPLPITSQSMSVTRTVVSGKQMTLGGIVLGGIEKQLLLTATLLEPKPTT